MIARGDLVVAPPVCSDPEFLRSVTLLTDHTAQGSRGLILNRATELTLNALLAPMDIVLPWQHQLYWGGPQALHTVFMLHSSEWRINNITQRIDRNWSLTTHWSMFYHLADHDEPQHWRVFAGCAAWAPGQLELEIVSDNPRLSWLTINRLSTEGLLTMDGLWSWAISRATEQAVSLCLA
jgi:putative transcriptional regulator